MESRLSTTRFLILTCRLKCTYPTSMNRRRVVKFVLPLALGTILASGQGASHQSGASLPRSPAERRYTVYDGAWWAAADKDEQAGFLEGSADCLTWAGHQDGFSETANQVLGKITKYYRTHPSRTNLLVTEVWSILNQDTARNAPAKTETKGETWTNPHWYLNGTWWYQVEGSERLGFIEGYLSCVRTHLKESPASYSRNPEYYESEISKYIKTHHGFDQAIAEILPKFRDQPKSP